jgi:RHS repeat-associated protein
MAAPSRNEDINFNPTMKMTPFGVNLRITNMKTRLILLSGALVLAISVAKATTVDNRSSYEAEIENLAVLYQPVVWVCATLPTDQEGKALAADLERIKAHGLVGGVESLEEFVAKYPNSGWTPSLQANLGRYYLDHGRYSDAIKSWEGAWSVTKTETSGPAKEVADFTFAYWTRLLVGIGEVNALRPLLDETQDRQFDSLAFRVMVNNTRQDYRHMVSDTDVSFRCGEVALDEILRTIGNRRLDLANTRQAASPATGFSLAKLAELSTTAGADMVAAKWGRDEMPVVPSVVHWKASHYAAIVDEQDGQYRVLDSVSRKPYWLSLADIRAEASGYFLVPKAKLPNDWKVLTSTEAEAVYGRGYVSSSQDGSDCCGAGNGGGGAGGGPSASGSGCSGCSKSAATGELTANSGNSPSGIVGGPVGGGATGGSGATCCQGGGGSGMPTWEVSEPCINVWLYDEPLGYQPAIGNRVSFKLAYKQRDVDLVGNPLPIQSNIFSVGNNWNCSWLSYVEDLNSGNALMFAPGGGARAYFYGTTDRYGVVTPPAVEYYSYTLMQRTTNTVSGAWTGFIVTYANGAQDFYQSIPTESLDGSSQVAFLSKKVDAYGHITQFVYQDTGTTFTLQSVIDSDNRTTTLQYNNANPSLITTVQDPFGHLTRLNYDNTGMLTNIVDTIGMTNSFKYDSLGQVTDLCTPYGTTMFEYFTNDVSDVFDFIRAVRVDDAAGGTNVYMWREQSYADYNYDNGTTNQSEYAAVFPSPQVPVTLTDPSLITYMFRRDTFHWAPNQAAKLPNDLTALGPSDYLNARMRHWLHSYAPQLITYYGQDTISQTLDMEQAPSPDGAQLGQTTWYGYMGQTYNPEDGIVGTEGTNSQPALIARVLPDGTTWYTWYQRDTWGRPTNVVDTYSSSYGAEPQTRTNIYVYDRNDINLIMHIGPLGETEGYTYDTSNHLLFYTNALQEVTAYTYDAQGRLTSITTPAGLVTTNSYYASGPGLDFLQTTIDLQINRTNSYTYANDLVSTHTDERELTTTNTWDALNRLICVTYPDGTFVTNAYYRLDLVQQIDRMRFKTCYGYDAVRRLIAVTNALENYTLYNYCPCGALESVQDAAGNATFFTYDNAGNQVLASYPDGYSVSYTYDLPGRQITSIDSGGVGITNWYNNQGLKYAVSNAVGVVSLLGFDAENHVTNSTDANHVSVSMAYDLLGRVLTRTYPDSGVESYGYTFGISGPSSYTNQIGNVTGYRYDDALRKIAETNALNFVTRFTNSPAGDLFSLTDGNSDTTTWAYDAYGRVTNKVDAAHNLLFVYQYDPDNRLTNRWSAAKGSTTYSYDSVGNLTGVVYPVSPAITLKYDVLNRLTNMVDALGATVYGYDAVGELTAETGPWASDTVNYTYENRLRMGLSLQTPGGASWTQSYGYDLARRLKTLTSPAGSFGYVYDPVEVLRVDKLTLPNGAAITNSFDSVARLTSTWLRSSAGADLDSYVYTYNRASQRTNVVRTAGDYVNYTYDNIGELKTALGAESGGATPRWQDRFGYAYDAAGNLNYRTNNALLAQFNVNSLNELTTVTNGGPLTVSGSTTSVATNVTVNTSNAVLYADVSFASTNQPWVSGANTFTAIAKDVYGRRSTNSISVTLAGTNSYSYDLNGNLLTDGTRGFAYDDENQLISVYITNTWRNDFVYDGKMRRRIERDYTWNAGTSSWQQANEIHFIYDGSLVIQERDINNQPQVTYTRGKDLSGSLEGAGGIGGLLARSDRNQVVPGLVTSGGVLQFGAHSYYHADGNGNVTMLIAASQMIVAKYLYDPFGNTLAKCGLLADVNNYGFSSKEWNRNSGLYYYLYRFYDPNLQRWANRDPIGEPGFEALRNLGVSRTSPDYIPSEIDDENADINLYLFLGNMVLSVVDVDGLKFWPPSSWPVWHWLHNHNCRIEGSCQWGSPLPEKPHTKPPADKWGLSCSIGWPGSPPPTPPGKTLPWPDEIK